MRFYCKCGETFSNQRHLVEHVGLLNPHWPCTSPTDEHGAIDRETWALLKVVRDHYATA